jgi:hypothetical protein
MQNYSSGEITERFKYIFVVISTAIEVVNMMAISRRIGFEFYWCNTTVAKPEDHGKAIQQ